MSDLVIELRPETQADRDLLLELFASTRREEFTACGWSGPPAETLFASQFSIREAQYRQAFPEAVFRIVGCDGKPIGRLCVDDRTAEIRVVDLSLLADWRGRGIGSRLLRELIDRAAVSGKPLRLHVEKHNPAHRLYTRLGFRPVAEHPAYDLLECRSALAGQAA